MLEFIIFAVVNLQTCLILILLCRVWIMWHSRESNWCTSKEGNCRSHCCFK